MTTTLFGDTIISSTELKNNQKKWFDKALETPISITNRAGRHFVLINREQVRNLMLIRSYSEKIVKYSQEVKAQKDTDNFVSDVFPWAKNLNRDERAEFRDELISAFIELMHINNWKHLDEIIGSWEATAEAVTNSRFMEVVNTDSSHRKFAKVE